MEKDSTPTPLAADTTCNDIEARVRHLRLNPKIGNLLRWLHISGRAIEDFRADLQ